TPTFCNHCKNAPCLAAAENGAVYRRDDGLIIIDPEKAAGQKQLVDACPYGAIYWNEALSLPQKCTGCAHLLDNGVSVPRCVEACPTDALVFGEESALKELLAGATTLRPELGLAPQVYYRHLPGQFIGGTVYDIEEEEIIEGAKCRLLSGGKTWIDYSDDFGDFWFKDLPEGKFSLVITAKGYKDVNIADISTIGNCVSLGDIPMEKK
ncbi:MAG: oxidoreductase, partial [Oscillospiraceae bacterium]|nr:oxidoreductase [Oscillospiraceae bacterium]